MANEKIVTLENLTTYNDKIQDTITVIEERIGYLESNSGVSPTTKILWLGTSIPAGDANVDPNNNYPKMVGDRLRCKVYNNSVPGSFMAWYSNAPTWTTKAQVDAEFATGYCLTATKDEIQNKYYNVLNTIRRNENLGTAWRDNLLNEFKATSYEELVIPYIDGTIDTCDVVVIDHGFNDRSNIFNVCGQHADSSKDNISYWPADQVGGATVEYPVTGGNGGWYWLTHLADSRYYDGFVYMNTLNELGRMGDGGMRGEYFGAMCYLINKIWAVNPRIRIIIGNYFSQDYGAAIGDNMNTFMTKFILEANSQIASYYGIECVDVYKYTGLRNRNITTNDGQTISDMYRFCPDGIHPSSDTTGESNKKIANVYVNAFRDMMYV